MTVAVPETLHATVAAIQDRWPDLIEGGLSEHRGEVTVELPRERLVEVGTFCTAQGALQQLGETTVALSTLVSCTRMRIHTDRSDSHTLSRRWWPSRRSSPSGSGGSCTT